MNKAAVLFDLDGVLIDSEGVYYDFWDNINKLYPTGIDNFAEYIKGMTLAKIMGFFKDEGVKADIIARLNEQERGMHYVIFDGVMPFLRELKSKKVKCAIVTSSNPDKVDKLFKQHPGFSDFFDAVITDRDVTRSKPDPQAYNIAAEKLNARPCDCYVFEDSVLGLKAARSSGAEVVGLTTTNPQTVVGPLSDIVINGFTDKRIAELQF